MFIRFGVLQWEDLLSQIRLQKVQCSRKREQVGGYLVVDGAFNWHNSNSSQHKPKYDGQKRSREQLSQFGFAL